MLDTSGSVGRSNHKKALSFIYNVVNYFNIGPNATQVALIPFATYVHSYFFFNRLVLSRIDLTSVKVYPITYADMKHTLIPVKYIY